MKCCANLYIFNFILFLTSFSSLIEPLLGRDTRASDSYRAGQSRSGAASCSRPQKRMGGMNDFRSGGPNAPPASGG